MGTYQDYYDSIEYVYEVFIVHIKSYGKQSLGFFDHDHLPTFMSELMLFLKDYPDFSWTVQNHRLNLHHDDAMGNAEQYIYARTLTN